LLLGYHLLLCLRAFGLLRFVALILWLLVFVVNEQLWKEQASLQRLDQHTKSLRRVPMKPAVQTRRTAPADPEAQLRSFIKKVRSRESGHHSSRSEGVTATISDCE